MSDLVERLRAMQAGSDYVSSVNDLCGEAADEIERLRSAIQGMLSEIGPVDGTMSAWLIGQAALKQEDSDER